MSRIVCKGHCHCGSVQFTVAIPRRIEVTRCNCSICSMTGHLHLIVAKEDFNQVSGMENLKEYRFNTRTATHLFCSTCGVKAFYIPRSHPDAWSVNLNCVELPPDVEVRTSEFDGENWEQNVARLRARSN